VWRLLSWKLGLQRLRKKSDRVHQAKTNEIHRNGFLVHQRSTAWLDIATRSRGSYFIQSSVSWSRQVKMRQSRFVQWQRGDINSNIFIWQKLVWWSQWSLGVNDMYDCYAGGPIKNLTVGSCVRRLNATAIESTPLLQCLGQFSLLSSLGC